MYLRSVKYFRDESIYHAFTSFKDRTFIELSESSNRFQTSECNDASYKNIISANSSDVISGSNFLRFIYDYLLTQNILLETLSLCLTLVEHSREMTISARVSISQSRTYQSALARSTLNLSHRTIEKSSLNLFELLLFALILLKLKY